MERNLQRSDLYELMLTGLLTALVMAATSFFRIPVLATNGYIHLGDTMVFLSVLILGRRNGTIAAASGSALADLLGGYAHWAPWTFVIKGLMAFVTATILYARRPESGDASEDGSDSEKRSVLTSAFAMTVGGLVMIAGYFIAQRILYGNFAAPLAALPGNIIQAAAGIIAAEAVSAALRKAAPQALR